MTMLLLAALSFAQIKAQPAGSAFRDEEESLLYYLPDGNHVFDPSVPTPYQVLGFNPGQRFVDWGDVTLYMQALDRASEKTSLKTFGKTYLGRTYMQLCISSEENIRNLESIRQRHLQLCQAGSGIKAEDEPVVVDLMGSIHGNEATGVAAALIQAYYFTASKDPEILKMLENTIVVITPGQNPDGLSRFSAWVNNTASSNTVASALQRQANEPWPSSRTNHYYADLNRDWLSVQHPEGRNCVAMYRWWMPDVVLDMHEQGSSVKGFYFSPGDANRTYRDIPQRNQDLLQMIADSTAAALDQKGSLYFSREGYDDYFIGKGAAYGDVQGSVCILHEQTGSYGHARELPWGSLLFPYTLRNQTVAGISVAKSACRLHDELLQYKAQFYTDQARAYRKDPVKGIAFSAGKDRSRAAELVDILLTHGIDVYEDKSREDSYVIPMEQDKYYVIKAMWDKNTEFADSTFYDISTWTFPCAFNVSSEELGSVKGRLGARIETRPVHQGAVTGGQARVAYLIPADDFYANYAVNRCLSKGLTVRVAKTAFTYEHDGHETCYAPGTAVVPVAMQDMTPEELYAFMQGVAGESNIDILSLSSGRMKEHDLGSAAFTPAVKPNVAILAGKGLGVPDTGEAWLLADRRMGFSHAVIDCQKIADASDLGKFNVMIMAGGTPSDSLGSGFYTAIREWVAAGGTLIASEGASSALRKAGLADFKPSLGKGVAGVILEAKIKSEGPLFWGMDGDSLPVFKKTASTYSTEKGSVLMKYADDAYISGCCSARNRERINGSPAILSQTTGKGRVIFFANDFNFRSYWYGTSRIYSNAILYGNLL